MNPMIAFLLAGVTATAPADAPLHTPAAVAARGEVKAGPVLTHTFTLTHRGKGKLAVTGVEGGCGCVRAAVSRSVLQPGETTELAVEVNTLTQPEGANAWKVTVRYQVEPPPAAGRPGELPAPRLPESFAAELRVTAKLVREVTVTPPSAAISTTGEATLTLTVADSRDRPLTVAKAVASSPHLSAVVGQAAVRDGKRVQPVELRLAATAPVGHHDETVTLTTDDPAYRELRVPVRVSKRAAGAVAVSPDAVALRFASGQVEASAVAVVRSLDGDAVKIGKAECDDPAVRLKWSPDSVPVATVRVTVSAGRSGRAEVRVLLAEPAGHTLRLPASWSAD
jgi:hypothetical protein